MAIVFKKTGEEHHITSSDELKVIPVSKEIKRNVTSKFTNEFLEFKKNALAVLDSFYEVPYTTITDENGNAKKKYIGETFNIEKESIIKFLEAIKFSRKETMDIINPSNTQLRSSIIEVGYPTLCYWASKVKNND